jgi:hypothetical protein
MDHQRAANLGQHQLRFRGEAEMIQAAKPDGSVENDPEQA